MDLGEWLAIPYLAEHVAAVEAKLLQIVSSGPASLKSPSRRVIKTGGKRLRATLVIASAVCGGKPVNDRVIAAAAAIELAHLGSLVHDDIIDEARTRHGQPTINAKEGSDQALLVGDYFLSLAAATGASVSQEAAQIVSQTIAEMCEGQSQETADTFNLSRRVASYQATISQKTAALFSAACLVGGLSTGISRQRVEALAAYGLAFGMAFQILDDLLDFVGDPKKTGKPAGTDLKEGVYTLPLLFFMRKNKTRLPKLLKNRITLSKLVQELQTAGVFEQTLQAAHNHNMQAVAALNNLHTTPVLEGLQFLPAAYLDWVLKQQTVLR